MSSFQQGLDCVTRRSPRQALHHFHQAERLGHDPCDCAAQRWQCWMLLGEFEQAWRESDAIARHNGYPGIASGMVLPSTAAASFVRCLHGFGDAIQFMRYARLLRRLASRVIVESALELVSLFRARPFIDEVVSWADGSSKTFSAWDQQIEVMEFPRIYRTTRDTIPPGVSYLSVPDDHSIALRSYAFPRPRIGLVWSASDWNPQRSMPPAALQSLLLSLEASSFYSFQHGERRRDLCDLQRVRGLHDPAPYTPEILDTAAALLNVDLLITVDTMAAHLAGALGIPVWMLLHYHSDWR